MLSHEPDRGLRAVFASIVDEERGGAFSIAPAEPSTSTRRYIEETNVPRTTFRATTGVVYVTDCLPLTPPGRRRRLRGGGPGPLAGADVSPQALAIRNRNTFSSS